MPEQGILLSLKIANLSDVYLGARMMHDKLLYFCHIPKAGGQTIMNMIQQGIGSEKCLKVWEPRFGADVSPDNFADLDENNLRQYRAIIGHLGYGQFLRNRIMRRLLGDGQIVMVTSVREPIARIVSNYNYLKWHPQFKGRFIKADETLEEYALAHTDNLHSRFLSKSPRSKIDEILQEFRVLPIESSVEQMSNILETESGCLPVQTEIRNQTSDLARNDVLATAQDLSKETRFRLGERHYFDRQLYERAGGKLDTQQVNLTFRSWLKKHVFG